jgi:hypothetical protein
MPTSWTPRAIILTLALGTAGFGCESGTAPRPAGTFLFQVRDAPGTAGQFVARTNDPDVIRTARNQLALPADERQLFINGALEHGDGGHNDPWSWHFVPSEWGLVDSTIELCDGRPQMVEDDLDYWVDHVGYYCPWSAYVVEER